MTLHICAHIHCTCKLNLYVYLLNYVNVSFKWVFPKAALRKILTNQNLLYWKTYMHIRLKFKTGSISSLVVSHLPVTVLRRQIHLIV